VPNSAVNATHPSAPTSATTSGVEGGSSLGDKVRGVAHVVHGLGETIRGHIISIVSKEEGSEILRQGKTETDQAMVALRGPAATQAAQNPQPGTTPLHADTAARMNMPEPSPVPGTSGQAGGWGAGQTQAQQPYLPEKGPAPQQPTVTSTAPAPATRNPPELPPRHVDSAPRPQGTGTEAPPAESFHAPPPTGPGAAELQPHPQGPPLT